MNRSEAVLLLANILSPVQKVDRAVQAMVKSETMPWNDIILIANRHLLIPALYEAVKRKEILENISDPQLCDYLREVYRFNLERNNAILDQISEISDLLQTLGVYPILLKGASALSENHYDTIGERAMIDIDLLVPPDKVMSCIELLKKNGYQETDTSAEAGIDWHHYKRMYKEGRPASLELHRYALSNSSYLPNELLKEHTIKSNSINNALILEPAYELYHAFLHSEIAHRYHEHHHLALRHLQHFAVMAIRYEQQADWGTLKTLIQKNDLQTIWDDYLYTLWKLFGLKTPHGIPDNGTSELHFQKLLLHIDQAGSLHLRVKTLFKRLRFAFSYDRLQKRYSFQTMHGYIFYIGWHVSYIIWRYMTKPKLWKPFVQGIRALSG